MAKLSFESLRCEMTAHKEGVYAVCLSPPAHLVWVADDRRAWLMCDKCVKQFTHSPRLVAEGSNSKLTRTPDAAKKTPDVVAATLAGMDAKEAIAKVVELTGGRLKAKDLRAATAKMNNGLARMYLCNKLRAYLKTQL